jgi:hypothetical protein
MSVNDRVPQSTEPDPPHPIAGYLTADWHWPERVGTGPWIGVPVTGDAEYALRQIVDRCIAGDCDLFAAGDIFDGPDPDPESVARLFDVLRPLADWGRSVLYVLGNHDRGRDWLAAFGPRAVNIDGRTVEHIDAGTVGGLSYVRPDAFEERVRTRGPVDLGLYHQTWSELVRGGRTPLRRVPDDRVALCGDVHVRRIVPRGPRSIAVSPGPLCPQSVTEFDVTPAVYALARDGTVTPRPLKGRVFARYEVRTADDLARTVHRIRSTGPDPDLPGVVARPFVCVRLSPELTDRGADALRAAAAASGAILRVDYDRSSGFAGPEPDRTVDPAADTLAAVVANWDCSEPTRALGAALLAPGADPALVLEAARAAAIKPPLTS